MGRPSLAIVPQRRLFFGSYFVNFFRLSMEQNVQLLGSILKTGFCSLIAIPHDVVHLMPSLHCSTLRLSANARSKEAKNWLSSFARNSVPRKLDLVLANE